ncbi:MAG: sodium:solute symporter [Bacteroidota bacterium]
MSPTVILAIIVVYFAILFLISFRTAGKADSAAFFSANKESPWYLVAFGMIGTSLSGLTFISVPGQVGANSFSYLQLVAGQLVGYAVVATVLMPMYYRMNLVSIYTYLERRFGFFSYKTGAFFFLLSRSIGSAGRFYLVIGVLQYAVFDSFGVPFWVSVMLAIGLIWLYTFRGGMKTIIYTDTLQSFFMLVSVGLSIWFVASELHTSGPGLVTTVLQSKYSKTIFTDFKTADFFLKQFIAGAFIAIAMTGLDQDLMQKNLTCKSIGEAKKNMLWFSLTLFLVNCLFMVLGASLYLYATARQIPLPANSDELFPMLALKYFSPVAGVVFILGIIAATYASTDSALTALTTSFCIDIIDFRNRPEAEQNKLRFRTHIGFSVLLFIIIIIFRASDSAGLIKTILKLAGYTYGPLLGLYAFGLFTRFAVRDKLVPLIAVVAPLLTYMLNTNSEAWFWGYKLGFEILLINGLITFIGLLAISRGKSAAEAAAARL